MKASASLQKLFRKELKADIVIKNAHILDPYHVKFTLRDISIFEGRIVAFEALESHHVIDADGQYLIPLLVDAHMHIESTTMLPNQLEQILLPQGVGTLIADPHELANVAGLDGIQCILDASQELDLCVKVMLPSSVPCIPFDHSGAVLTSYDLESLLDHPHVHGLAEVMDKTAVRDDEDMLRKIIMTQNKKKNVDGHGANLEGLDEDLYLTMGVNSDHECTTSSMALSRLEKGMMVFIREGSVTKNLDALLPCITPFNCRRFCFCTDDVHPDDIYTYGGIDYVVKQAIRKGLDPALAYTMATYHPSLHYQLHDEGVIACGNYANFFLMKDFTSFKVSEVYKHGRCVARNGQCSDPIKEFTPSSSLYDSIHVPDVSNLQFECVITTPQSKVIVLESGNVVTRLGIETIDKDEKNCFIPNPHHDLAKLSVCQRHNNNGQIAHCPVQGFKLIHGAIASSVAHDSHNLVIASTNDEDARYAIEALKEVGGGIVVVQDQRVLARVTLEIAGLLTAQSLNSSVNDWKALHHAYSKIAHDINFNPFVMLSFLALPVIPDVKLTDSGLVDVRTSQIIPLEVHNKRSIN